MNACPRSGKDTGSTVDALTLLREHGYRPLGEALDHTLREALIDLSARSVRVLWQGGVHCDLRSIPEVREAVPDAWTCLRGLELQLVASRRGEVVPTWPVLIQREVRP